jgi:hypothetical protein
MVFLTLDYINKHDMISILKERGGPMPYTDFLDLAQARYSVRKFLDKKVPKDIIEKILKAGMLAPTGCNNQPQRIIVVESAEGLAKIK